MRHRLPVVPDDPAHRLTSLEPDLGLEVVARQGAALVVQVHLGLGSAGPADGELSVRLTTSPRALDAAARAWEDQLQPFPPRSGS